MFVLLFALTLLAAFALYTVLGNEFFIRLRHDTRGVVPAGMQIALQDRGDGMCSLARLPTGRYPQYSTTLTGTFDAAGNATLELEAERDLLLFGLSVDSASPAGSVFVNLTYCGVAYLINSSMRTWRVCCDRKPIFFVGVREGKTLKFTVTGGTEDDDVSITLHGIQGNGCCA